MHFMIFDEYAMALEEAQERIIVHIESHTEINASQDTRAQLDSFKQLHKSQK